MTHSIIRSKDKMEVRKRRTRGPSSSASPKGVKRRTHAEAVDNTFTQLLKYFLVVAVFSFVLTYTLATFWPKQLDAAAGAIGIRHPEYAVVIDAGSSGSRVLAFTFHRCVVTRSLILDDELWHEVKPGVSAYAEKPEEAAESIKSLLAIAKARIPQAAWSTTPVTLKATAGLRLLPSDRAKAILEAVSEALNQSGLAPEGEVEILDPEKEGILAWFTVNFLTGRLGNQLDSYATLDLGGGSTQISFAPESGAKIEGLQGRKGFLHNVTLQGQALDLYSYSYLGLGLNSAREAVFKSDAKTNAAELYSPCVTHHHEPLSWTHGGREYKIHSRDASFENCIKVVNRVVNSKNVHAPTELHHREVAAFSYFFDRATERRLLPEDPAGGSLKISTYIYEAQRACDPYSNSQFYCVDLAYISALLTKGYNLPPDKEISLFKKIDGHEVSWALGLAYSILDRKM